MALSEKELDRLIESQLLKELDATIEVPNINNQWQKIKQQILEKTDNPSIKKPFSNQKRIVVQIRDLMRYRFKLINVKSSEKNRIQNSLTVSNIMISSVVSDTFGVSSMRIINHILDNPDDKDFEVTSMLHGSMQDKAEIKQLRCPLAVSEENARSSAKMYRYCSQGLYPPEPRCLQEGVVLSPRDKGVKKEHTIPHTTGSAAFPRRDGQYVQFAHSARQGDWKTCILYRLAVLRHCGPRTVFDRLGMRSHKDQTAED